MGILVLSLARTIQALIQVSTSTLNTTRPIVGHSGEMCLKGPALVGVDLLDFEIAKQRGSNLGHLEVS